MSKTILITGATDGIGFLAAKQFVKAGHQVIIHGRNPQKLKKAQSELVASTASAKVETLCADLSDLKQVSQLADEIKHNFIGLDVLVNNAGVFNVPNPVTADGLDSRFVVNTIAPYWLSVQLFPLFNANARVINLSSAAQAPLNTKALLGEQELDASNAYAQSKLAIASWTHYLSQQDDFNAINWIALNPASLLGSKMVKEAYGIAGKDLNIGANVIYKLACVENLAGKNGAYFDNDAGQFRQPHPEALDKQKNKTLIELMDGLCEKYA